MSRRGENIHKRKDGRWEGRYIKNYDINGKAQYGSVYSKSYLVFGNFILLHKEKSIQCADFKI